MVFNNIFSPKIKKTERELFLAVEIHESLIKTAVWQVESETPSLVALGGYELWDSEDSLINGVDASLTEAIKGLDAKPDRVIFGLPESWLVQNRVHPTKQKIIKRLKDELKLKPIGVVTITEAIIRHLKIQEGVPPTAILLEIYPSKVIVSLINVGEKQAIEEVGRSDDLARDVEEGLARFDAEKLPARFILTNGSDLENEEQQIISYPWTDKLPFIHLPKVQVLPIDFSIRAVALSGGSEAAKSLGIDVAPEESSSHLDSPVPTAEVEPIDTDDLFSIGFSVEGEAVTRFEESNFKEIIPDEVEAVPQPDIATPNLTPLSQKLSKLSLPKITLPQLNLSPRLLWFVPPLVILISVLAVVGYYFYFGRIQVTLAISPVRESQSFELAIGTSPRGDLLTVLATKKTVSARESGSTPTTGETTVGEKATGKVTIYNKLGSGSISLKTGTKIVASGGQIFALDSAITIASSSADPNPPFTITPGSAAVNVTAVKIGADSNLNKAAQFSVDTYPKSSLIASADNDFSGGTSRVVKAVAKADQEKLLADLSEKIKAAIDDQLKADDPDNRSLAIGSMKYTTKEYDHEFAEEATSLSLDLASDLDVLVYSRKQLISQIENKIMENAKPGLVLASEQTQVGLTDPAPLDSTTFSTKANVQAVLVPQIDQAGLVKSTTGKKVANLQSQLESIAGFSSASIHIYPPLPFLDSFLPFNPKNFVFNIVIR
jgi:hypothetical protein